jgi:hypothetical protein
MVDQEKGCLPQCGYGLLGLCCTACLHGPCRRSPFEADDGGRFCGEDSDWIVAHNILQRVSVESLQTMAAFRNALEQASGPENRIEAPRLEEMKRLLLPFSRGENSLLKSIYPERAFPCLHALEFPAGSWFAALLDMVADRPQTMRNTEAQLAKALCLSAMALAAEALLRELAGPASEEMTIALPDDPSPLLLLVSDEESLQDDGREGLLNQLESACREKVLVCRLQNMAQLPALGRQMYERWGIPASMSGSIAVAASSSMIRGLGALALGFSLASLPGYPIHGSLRVENYLTQQLKKTFGHAYLSVKPMEDLCEQILGSLKP